MTEQEAIIAKARLAALDLAANLETEEKFAARLDLWRRFERVDLSKPQSANFMEGYCKARWSKPVKPCVTTSLEEWIAQVARS